MKTTTLTVLNFKYWILLLLLAGCAEEQIFTRPQEVSQEESRRDSYECKLQAAQATQGIYAANVSWYWQLMFHDSEKNKLFNECMLSRGYVPAEAKETNP